MRDIFRFGTDRNAIKAFTKWPERGGSVPMMRGPGATLSGVNSVLGGPMIKSDVACPKCKAGYRRLS